jgi:ATP-dependent DNA ligase
LAGVGALTTVPAGTGPPPAAAAAGIEVKSFTIDGEAVVVGPDGLSKFEELRRRTAAHAAVLYAFDLIEHDGEDLLTRSGLLFRLRQKIFTKT